MAVKLYILIAMQSVGGKRLRRSRPVKARINLIEDATKFVARVQLYEATTGISLYISLVNH